MIRSLIAQSENHASKNLSQKEANKGNKIRKSKNNLGTSFTSRSPPGRLASGLVLKGWSCVGRQSGWLAERRRLSVKKV